jgi:transcriptional regulator with GAF, ATPase, and Fis domain
VQPIKVDVRVIAATNRNLEEAVAARAFREDLYYRLNVFPITVPPLRERVKDIPVLVWSFVDEFSRSCGKTVQSISNDSMLALQRYAWPGNIRELRNTVERAMIVATGRHLVIEPPQPISAAGEKSLKIADVEARHIRAVLTSTGWRVRGPGGAAELLDMKPTTLEGRMARLGIRRNGRRS